MAYVVHTHNNCIIKLCQFKSHCKSILMFSVVLHDWHVFRSSNKFQIIVSSTIIYWLPFLITGICWTCCSLFGLCSWAIYSRINRNFGVMDVCQFLDYWNIVYRRRYPLKLHAYCEWHSFCSRYIHWSMQSYSSSMMLPCAGVFKIMFQMPSLGAYLSICWFVVIW